MPISAKAIHNEQLIMFMELSPTMRQSLIANKVAAKDLPKKKLADSKL